jgi:IclR-like helix-turn-helix domain-containing protein/hydroxymethylglutaryl-coenzyme A lyase family protein
VDGVTSTVSTLTRMRSSDRGPRPQIGSPTTGVLGKALAILNAFTADDRDLGFADLMRRTGLPKATLHRVAGDLVEAGLLTKHGTRYRLSTQLFALGMRASTELSLNYGPGSNTDWEWIEAAAAEIRTARLTTLLLPGVGTIAELRHAYDLGVRSVRVATHCTEADVSAQHIATARDLGMDVAGFLMMSHMAPAAELARQAKLMESYGAHCVYVTDSGGRLTMDGPRPGRRPGRHDRRHRAGLAKSSGIDVDEAAAGARVAV